MKNPQAIFIAFCAMAGVAQAQSSVTLYGIADAYVGRISSETHGAVPVAKLSKSVMNSGGMSNSRWGMRGSEDLGSGLRANFVLESALAIDTGAAANLAPQGNTLFGRQAIVGVSGGFGSLSFGRQTTAYDAFRSATNMLYDKNFAATGPVWDTGVADYQSRASNSIAYVSPTIGGISAGFNYGMGENKTATTAAESTSSLYIQYANGPLLVGYAHQGEKQIANGANNFFGSAQASGAAALPSTISENRKYNMLGASYEFGFANLTGAYNEAKNGKLKDKEYEIGISVPFGAAAMAIGYSHAESDGTGVASTKGTGFSLLGTYSMSKRTTLYVGYLNTKVASNVALGQNTVKKSTLGTGIRHAF